MPSTAESPAAASVRVGRQPIFDAELRVIGYELLYRGSDNATTCTADSQMATAVVVTNTMLEFGLETLTGGSLAFFNCDAGTWRQELFELLPKDQVVLEVLEDAVVGEVEPYVRMAKERGYRIALDDVVSASDREQLLPYADIIKLELPALSNEQIRDITRSNHRAGRKVLAEKVETQEEFDHAKQAGCDYFQGYFFAKPSTVRSERQLPQSHLQTLQLLSDLTDEKSDADTIADKVACDVALSVRLLRYANSAAVGCREKLSSIQRAVSMVGFETLRKWAQVLALSGLSNDKPSELMMTALTRARFCELIASRGRGSHPTAFTVGLLSLLDAMLDRPLSESFAELTLADDVEAALLDGTGELGTALALAKAYERFDLDAIETLAPEEPGLDTELSNWFVESVEQAQAYYRLTS